MATRTMRRKSGKKVTLHGRGARLAGLKTKYRVGSRVKVKFKEVRKKEIQCDKGTIVGIKWRFPQSETHRCVRYKVIFDKPYLKPECVMFKNIEFIFTRENSITLIKD